MLYSVTNYFVFFFFFFSSRRRHTRWTGDWSSDVCSSDLATSSWEDYVLPGLDLLEEHSFEARTATDPSELQEVQQVLIETLAQFGIAVAPGDITKGPTITRYEVYPAKGVRVDKIVSLERDL